MEYARMKPIAAKDDPVRSRALRKAADGAECVGCRTQDGTVVLAHLPGPGDSGRGIKTDDYYAAHLCSVCHTYADGADGRRDWMWRSIMIHRTWRRLVQSGVLVMPA